MFFGLVIAAGCGAKVVVDPLGTGGGGGAGGGNGGAGPVVGTTVTIGPGPQVASAIAVGPGTTVTVGPGPGPQTVTGPMSCDGQGDCGSCLSCAVNSSCADLWTKCESYDPCWTLLKCLNDCVDPQCKDKCVNTFPDGVDLYNQTAICLICNACYGDCDGGSQGCP